MAAYLYARPGMSQAERDQITRRLGGRPLDWSLTKDKRSCKKCRWSTVLWESAVGHQMGCTQREVVAESGGEPVPIIKARTNAFGAKNNAHICGPIAKYWEARQL